MAPASPVMQFAPARLGRYHFVLPPAERVSRTRVDAARLNLPQFGAITDLILTDFTGAIAVMQRQQLPVEFHDFFNFADRTGVLARDWQDLCQGIVLCSNIFKDGLAERGARGFIIRQIVQEARETVPEAFVRNEVEAVLGNKLTSVALNTIFIKITAGQLLMLPPIFYHLGQLKVKDQNLSPAGTRFYAFAYERTALLGLRQTFLANIGHMEEAGEIANTISRMLRFANKNMSAAYNEMPAGENERFVVPEGKHPAHVAKLESYPVQLAV